MRKFLSVLLAMAMVLSLTVTGFAIEDTATTREPEVMTEEATMAGKTVILHTNDVHGAVEGYAYIAQLKADYRGQRRGHPRRRRRLQQARPMSAPPRALMRSR